MSCDHVRDQVHVYHALALQQTFPQALWCAGDTVETMLEVAKHWIATLWCASSTDKPCRKCHACQYVFQQTHPDVHWICPDEKHHSIKIEQIRTLQETFYQTPTQQSEAFVVVYPVDTIHPSAAHALLKILEEPPSFMHWILLSSSFDVLPTLRSRCQPVWLKQPIAMSQSLLTEEEIMRWCRLVLDLFEKKVNVCEAAMEEARRPLASWLYDAYRFTADCIMAITLSKAVCSEYRALLNVLCVRFKEPMHLYALLDVILSFMTKQHMGFQPQRVIETVLLEWMKASYAYTQTSWTD